MKRENWIKWDLDSRSGRKMASFVAQHGATGYGIFIMLIEMLYREDDNKIPYDTNVLQSYTNIFKVDTNLFKAILNTLLYEGLLIQHENYIWSPRVVAEMVNRKDLSNKRRDAVNDRWAKNSSKKDTKVLQTDTSAYKPIQTDTDKRRLEEIRLDKNNTNTHVAPPSIKNLVAESLKEASLSDNAITATWPPAIDPTDTLARWLPDAYAQFDPSSQEEIGTGRRPMKTYPEIFITAHELAECFKAYDGIIPKSEWRRVFVKVKTWAKSQMADTNMKPQRIRCAMALMGWAKKEVIEELNSEVKLKKK